MSNTLQDSTVIVRSIYVGTRVADQVTDAESGADSFLLETQLGRYLLDSDGRMVWMLFDGRRTVADIAQTIAASSGRAVNEVREPLVAFVSNLRSLGLVEAA